MGRGISSECLQLYKEHWLPGSDERGPLARINDRGLPSPHASICPHLHDHNQRIDALASSFLMKIQTMAIAETLCTIQP